jgi:acetamidase/formamidase
MLLVKNNTTHELPLIPENIHWGYYDPSLKPVLTIASGDTVRVETILARGLQRLKDAGVPDQDIPESLKVVDDAVKERLGAHPLTGPIYIERAEPGDTLAVKVVDIQFLHPFGVAWFLPELGTLPEDFPYSRYKIVRFNPNGTADFGSGIRLKLAPFFGSIGVAPAMGRIPSGPPGTHAGNIDNKELVAGSTLYIPVHVPGGLLSLGDGHAIQGDGEVILSAVETSLRGTVQISLLKGKHLNWPRAETPSHYITMGMNPDLDEAAKLATREMVDFLVSEKNLSRDDAYFLCSMAVDLHVTQLVNGPKGVHAMVAKSIFDSASAV